LKWKWSCLVIPFNSIILWWYLKITYVVNIILEIFLLTNCRRRRVNKKNFSMCLRTQNWNDKMILCGVAFVHNCNSYSICVPPRNIEDALRVGIIWRGILPPMKKRRVILLFAFPTTHHEVFGIRLIVLGSTSCISGLKYLPSDRP
jgi:hypothetical protein